MKNKYIVHIEDNKESKPRPHEETASQIIASSFRSDIVFLRRHQSKNPDLFILRTNMLWELKSPIGNSKHTIQNNLRDAGKQSENIIIDLRRTKMYEKQAISRIYEYMKKEHTRIKQIKVITKASKVIDILDK